MRFNYRFDQFILTEGPLIIITHLHKNDNLYFHAVRINFNKDNNDKNKTKIDTFKRDENISFVYSYVNGTVSLKSQPQ